MPSTRASTRKKQTRLTFTPVPSSSPQRPIANIRVDESSSPAKKRRIESDFSPAALHGSPFHKNDIRVVVDSPSTKPTQLPTPAASSQVDVESELKDDVICEEPSRDGAGTGKPSAAGASTLHPSSEEDGPVSRTTRRRRPVTIALSSSNSDASETIPPALHRSHGSSASSSQPQTQSEIVNTPSRPRSTKSFLLGGTSGAAPISHSAGRKNGTPSKQWRQTDPLSITSDDSGSSVNGKTLPRTSPKRALRPTAKSRSLPQARRGEKYKLDRRFSGSDSGDLVRIRNGKQKALASSNSRQKPAVSVVVSERSEASNGSDVISTPGRKRLKSSCLVDSKSRVGARDSGEVTSDLDEEVADLSGADIRRSRTRGKPQNTERNKRLNKLEELKRRRAGIVNLDDDESDEARSEDDEPSEVEYQQRHDSVADLDQYEEDFLDDEGDQSIGVDLARGGVPLHMTRYANLKPLEYFQYEVEWMIHNKLDPAFERKDEVYELAHKKLDDEVMGHAGSTFKSAAWNQKFTNALMSRPESFRMDVPTMFEHKCDACNRSGHPPKHKLTLTGSKYDKDTLESISSGETDEESVDEGATNENDEDCFLLGRFCCANAEIAHALYHWRYHLNQTVLEWLSVEGHTSPAKIVERETWNRKKREKLANKVVDGMIERGEMRDLYRQFKQNLDAARSAKVGFPSSKTIWEKRS